VEAQVCTGGVRFDGLESCMDEEIDKYFFLIKKGEAVYCDATLDNQGQYYVTDSIYEKFGLDADKNPLEHVRLPDNAIGDNDRTFFVTVRLEKYNPLLKFSMNYIKLRQN
jgi:hypothetical protein